METSSPQNENQNETETEAAKPGAETVKPDDIRAKTPMEHWLKRQFPAHTLKGMLEAIRQLESGTPVPYLAFFAGDQTGGLKTEDLYKLQDARAEWEEVSRKQQHILQEVQSQGKLDDELKQQIERSSDLDRLEDVFAPFKLKRQTLGVQAREAGLGTLADYLWDKAHGKEVAEIPGDTLEAKAAPFAKADSKYADTPAVLKGVQDLLVERIAEAFELRSLVRSTVLRRSKIRAAKGPKAKPKSKYGKYFEYQEPIGSLKKPNASHRYLAMRRGWMEDELVLSFERPDEGILLEKFEEFACPQKDSPAAELLIQAARLALKGNVYTVMENEAHRHLKEEAELHVMQTLSENLRKKLLRPGLGQKAVMGIDPGSANHPCSLALVDQTGKLLLNLPFKLEEATDSNKQEFLSSLESLKIEAIAVAHGPRSKEVRESFKKMLEESGKNLPIITVHEHTSSIYSSSPAAKEEFPSLEVNARRAIFVARYLQDPLSMILKLDPKFLSLGEFQHEVSQSKLRQALNRTIESAVNFVGVDPNTAPAHVLAHVSGISQDLAKAIVQNREANGKFSSREDLKRVPGLAAKFDQAAGFLRIMDSKEKLDTTFIHPCYYAPLKELAKAHGAEDPLALSLEQKNALLADEKALAAFGAANTKNIGYELSHPGEDPRGPFVSFEYDPSLKSIADLKKGVAYSGVVTNVTSFGAFVDIGIEQDGLVHISELSESLVKNPFDLLFPGDPLTVWVGAVNEEKKQISLTMRDPSARPARQPRGDRRPRSGDRPPRGRGPRPDQRSNSGAEGGAPSGERPQRQFRGRPPRGPGGPVAPGAEGEGGDQRRGRFRGRDGERGPGGDRPQGDGPRGPGGPGGERKGRPDKDRKPKKPMRDSKTGAIVKLDDEYGKADRSGPKVAAKAKPHTFNPFANLADILKDKSGKNKQEE
ncbi:MAG: Tex-like N-terminal domain-containing protein [Bacteriovoracia bacterium]